MPIDYTHLFRSVPDLYVVLDLDFRIVDASDAYLNATMVEREAIVGRYVFDVFPEKRTGDGESGVSRIEESFTRAIETRRPDAMAVQRFDIERPASEGGGLETRYWSPTNVPVLDPDGEVVLLINRVKDVTEFVLHEQMDAPEGEGSGPLLDGMQTMEAEILNRSAELREANQELRALSSAKDDFLSRMSHELRTPLTAVIGYSELMKLDLEPGSPMAEDLEAIHRAGTHLATLVDEVLDFARIESGRLPISIEPVSARDVLREAFELTKPLAQSSGIGLTVANSAESEFVRADHQRLKQVLVNLISNAIKYNSEGGSVAVEIAECGPGRTCFAVADDGWGIAEHKRDDLFTPFERLGAEVSGVQGTGLGLALSQRLVQAMDGEISCDSVEGEGSTFSVVLAAAEPASIERELAGEDPVLTVTRYGAPRTILYVEDTVANVRLVESILRLRPDVTLIPAMQGQVGIDLAREHRPDLVLLDLHLPDIGGIEVLKRIRANPETAGLRVAILTADATKPQRVNAMEVGADAFLTKPIVVSDLLRTVDGFLAGSAAPSA